jgi:coenzyme F420-reducing hydrogenase gamma subunit
MPPLRIFSANQAFNMTQQTQAKLRVAVHKFSSCDGCQLTLLNLGDTLLTLVEQVEFIHFAEAGLLDETAKVELAFVEGSISTPQEQRRIKTIRAQTDYLVTIGACATAGGIQALRNDHNHVDWLSAVYEQPEHIDSLATSTSIAQHVPVDFELWGCPVNAQQLLAVIGARLAQVKPDMPQESLCLSCKRAGYPCVMVTQQAPCLGPVTRGGCGALCPGVGRACYGCFGPAETTNTSALSDTFSTYGLTQADIKRRFQLITSQAPAFKQAEQQIKVNRQN